MMLWIFLLFREKKDEEIIQKCSASHVTNSIQRLYYVQENYKKWYHTVVRTYVVIQASKNCEQKFFKIKDKNSNTFKAEQTLVQNLNAFKSMITLFGLRHSLQYFAPKKMGIKKKL